MPKRIGRTFPISDQAQGDLIHTQPSRAGFSLTEGDLIVGAQQRSAVATLVERKMRLTVLIRLPHGHSAQHVGDALITTFAQLPVKLRRTLTWDQGNEMFHHERIEAATGLKIYFADPHSPWQRGSNENTVSVGGGPAEAGSARLVPAA